MPAAQKYRVLFVCVGNACRSPMAEAIARMAASDVIEAQSAGLTPLGNIPDLTRQTLEQNGYEAEGLASTRILPDVWAASDLVVNMSGSPRQQAFVESEKVEDWEVRDPYGADAQTYQQVFEEIEERVRELAEWLRKKQREDAGKVHSKSCGS